MQVGDKVGRLTILEKIESKEFWSRSENRIKKMGQWRCLCDCGTEVVKTTRSLRNTRSCGCLLKESYANGGPRKTHGMTGTRLYRIYYDMKERCYYPRSINYNLYGGRGIKVCEEWLSDFMNFYNWAMENGYSDNLSIDRLNPDGNYEPNNCRCSEWGCFESERLSS